MTHPLSVSNRKILAYVREFDGETDPLRRQPVPRQAQAVELDLAAYKGGQVPVETDRRRRLPAGRRPATYMLTLPAYGFFWFLLADEADQAPALAHVQAPDPFCPNSSR